jgi:hypothetical protein
VPFRLFEEETRLARERSPDLLRAAIVRRVVEGADEWRKDERDVMVALAPLRHCADVIGADAAALFADAAREVPPDLRDTIEAMAGASTSHRRRSGLCSTRPRRGRATALSQHGPTRSSRSAPRSSNVAGCSATGSSTPEQHSDRFAPLRDALAKLRGDLAIEKTEVGVS